MGNRVIKTCRTPAVIDEVPENREAVEKSTTAGHDGDGDCGVPNRSPSSSAGKRGCLKLKVVLTKAELEWLMLRLKDEKGGGAVEGAALEQALEKIRENRKRDIGGGEKKGRPWKPSLERIVESPETPELRRQQLSG